MLRAFQQLTGRAHGLATFVITTLIFLLLGLLEVDVTKRKLENLPNKELGRALVAACTEIGAKFRKIHAGPERDERPDRGCNLGVLVDCGP